MSYKSICAVPGVKAWGMKEGKYGLALIEAHGTAAGVFTENLVRAAPVELMRKQIKGRKTGSGHRQQRVCERLYRETGICRRGRHDGVCGIGARAQTRGYRCRQYRCYRQVSRPAAHQTPVRDHCAEARPHPGGRRPCGKGNHDHRHRPQARACGKRRFQHRRHHQGKRHDRPEHGDDACVHLH